MNATTLISGTHSPILLAVGSAQYWIVNTTEEDKEMVKPNEKEEKYWEQLEKELGGEKFDEFLDKFETDFEREFGNALRK